MMLKWYSDPSHAWLEVTLEAVDELGLDPTVFSAYSYQRWDEAGNILLYLEEDSDAGVFLKTWEEMHGKLDYIIEIHSDTPSFVRDLTPIKTGRR